MATATRYYGEPPGGETGVRFTAPIIALMVAATVAGVAAWSVVQQRRQIAEATADTHAEAIVGPACPEVRGAAFRLPVKPDRLFDFDGVSFGRRFGQADCSAIARKSALGVGYEVLCQFSGPAVLSVRTARGMAYFEPGSGRAASVFVRDGAARCVLSSPYWDRYYQLVTETGPDGRPLPFK